MTPEPQPSQSAPRSPNLGTSVAQAVVVSLFIAAALGALAIVLTLVSAGEVWGANGITLPRVLGYLLGLALAVGLIVGLLRPHLRGRAGACLIGAACGIPFFAGGTLIFGNDLDLGAPRLWGFVVAVGSIYGAFMGLILWNGLAGSQASKQGTPGA